jgi:signal transduction histidine kinase
MSAVGEWIHSRQGGPVATAEHGGRPVLGRMSIRTRLNLVITLPMVAILGLTGGSIAARIQTAQSAKTVAASMRAADQVGALVDDLQQEQLQSVAYLSAPTADPKSLLAAADAVDALTRQVSALAGAGIPAGLPAAVSGIDALATLRSEVLSRSIPAENTNTGYDTAINALIDALALDQGGNPAGDSLDALFRAGQAANEQDAALLASAADPSSAEAELLQATGFALVEQDEAARLQRMTSPGWFQLYQLTEVSPAAQTIADFEVTLEVTPDAVGAAAPGHQALVGQLSQAVSSQARLRLRTQEQFTGDVAAAAASSAAAATWWAAVIAAAAAVLFTAIVLLSIAVRRSVTRPLDRLTTAASQIAELSHAELARVADDDSVEQAPPGLPALEAESPDELGALAIAFNQVQATAIALLERQVVSRRNVAEMFGNVGRRIHTLTDQQVALLAALDLDELAEGRRSSAAPSRLRRLDQLCSRLQRHADSLAVLSGIVAPPATETPMSLADVVQAAVEQIGGTDRVELGTLDDRRVAPWLTEDLTLLLAELLDNAVSFSPAGPVVRVTMRAEPQGRVVIIADHGSGMTVQRLAEENSRLLKRERIDLAPTEHLGLLVVGRLCRRTGLRVVLSSTAGGGVTATIRIPAGSLVADPPSVWDPRAGSDGPWAKVIPLGDRTPGAQQPDVDVDVDVDADADAAAAAGRYSEQAAGTRDATGLPPGRAVPALAWPGHPKPRLSLVSGPENGEEDGTGTSAG